MGVKTFLGRMKDDTFKPERRKRRKNKSKRSDRATPAAGPTESEKTILRQRAQFYGPSPAGTRNIAAATASSIRAILMAHWQMSLPEISPHITHLILNQIKVIRAAAPFKCRVDTYEDCRNYVTLAQSLDDRMKGQQNGKDPHVRVLQRIRSDLKGKVQTGRS